MPLYPTWPRNTAPLNKGDRVTTPNAHPYPPRTGTVTETRAVGRGQQVNVAPDRHGYETAPDTDGANPPYPASRVHPLPTPHGQIARWWLCTGWAVDSRLVAGVWMHEPSVRLPVTIDELRERAKRGV